MALRYLVIAKTTQYVVGTDDMHEDDTFRKLKRKPVQEVFDTFQRLDQLEKYYVLVNNQSRETWLNKHGWTLAEYREARFPSTIE